MARDKANLNNIDGSDPIKYPNKRIKDNSGAGDGTPVNELVYGDIHEFFAKLMRLYDINYNGLPDNENNGYQLVDAVKNLASKNDYVLPISNLNSTTLSVPIKISKMIQGESFIGLASVDLLAENLIKGSDTGTFSINFIGSNFKNGDYLRITKTAAGVNLDRLVNSANFEVIANELGYILPSTLPEELAGAISTKATTPLTNFTAFTERVNGVSSDNFLAEPNIRNGLLSKIDKEKIDNLIDPTSLIKITGGTGIQVTSWQDNVDNSDNFNFNYIDVYPPTGKTIDNLKGFMASLSQIWFDGQVDSNDTIWCKWQIQANKIRVIAGTREGRAPAKVNWQAIWI